MKVSQKLDIISKSKANAGLALWTKIIANQMYWSSVSSPEGEDDRGQLVKQKWLSVLNYAVDVHEGYGHKFPKCVHGEMEPKA